ncbi:MAG TPA: ribosome recycling factor [Candidatus Saccharimonadales bacterium]|jgi:ribosome recycling factor|nr:ribosome recycling factor [Candidatus Saccharimonadales bacterium]
MNDAVFTQLQKEMDGSVNALRKELTKVRTGRASTSLLDHVSVDYYGATTPLNQLATLSAPEPRLLVIQPFDRSAMGEIEKAILKSDLGLTPNNDGKIIRIPIPALTEERRKDLVKHVKKVAEEFRVSLRNHRRLAIEHLKEAEKKKEITADDAKHGQERIQKITDEFIGRIDKILKSKEEEVMEV